MPSWFIGIILAFTYFTLTSVDSGTACKALPRNASQTGACVLYNFVAQSFYVVSIFFLKKEKHVAANLFGTMEPH
jgi:hypothetical protein